MKTKRFICTVMIASMLAGIAGCSTPAKETTTSGGTSAPAVHDEADRKEAVTNAAGDVTTEAEASGSTTTDKSKSDSLKTEITADEGKSIDKSKKTEPAAAERSIKDGVTFDTDADVGGYGSTEGGTTAEPEIAVEPEASHPSSQTSVPEYGQLTAGEWNDNANWGFFTNLVNGGKIKFPSFGLDPVGRTKVTVKDSSGKAVINAAVSMKDEQGGVIWSAITNKNGEAYLFEKTVPGTSIEVTAGGKTQSYQMTAPAQNQQGQQQQSVNPDMEVVFDGAGTEHKKTDIMFILDTTGSMDDEMLFLQSEFTAITKAIGTQDIRYSINFYRDEGDDYVTKCFDFTDDISTLQSTLNSECADGGGDTPEAVAEILDESIHKSSWQEDSVKLAFLIFDAPPHDDKNNLIYQTIKDAAEKGIHIIPVISSNSERETELFGRALAIMTDGTYVFLTDDSGIGSSHLEPIIGDYQVEKLYDIIIRIVNDYKQ